MRFSSGSTADLGAALLRASCKVSYKRSDMESYTKSACRKRTVLVAVWNIQTSAKYLGVDELDKYGLG